MNKKKLIIIIQAQFGYHIDTYYYCKYLRDHFDITYVCWDYRYPRVTLDKVRTVYISRKGNLIIRNLKFLYRALNELRTPRDFHIIKYFRGCSILKLVYPKKKFLFDVRTGSTNNKAFSRAIYNYALKFESSFFKHISVISKSLAKKFGFSKSTHILPLGADIISETTKKFDSIRLLYVGTLSNRNIHQALKGFSKFYHEYKDHIKLQFTIVGSGYQDEEKKLNQFILKENMTTVVQLAGQIPHNKIQPFFDSHNIGVSYIPQTDYFDAQPPTKTFEYLLSGMPVVATSTKENRNIITRENGVLINDTSDSFYNGLVKLYDCKDRFCSGSIRKNALNYSWVKIVSELKSLIDHLSR